MNSFRLILTCLILSLIAIPATALAGGGERGSNPEPVDAYATLTIYHNAHGLKGNSGVERRYRVRCASKTSSIACRRVAAMMRGTAPAVGGEACTKAIYGSHTALVVGTIRGKAIYRRLNQAGSCNNRRMRAATPFLRAAGAKVPPVAAPATPSGIEAR